jgi:serine/threonine protein phosphatase PrpC
MSRFTSKQLSIMNSALSHGIGPEILPYSSSQHSGYKNPNEDTTVSGTISTPMGTLQFHAVFDGHGGLEVSRFLGASIGPELENYFRNSPKFSGESTVLYIQRAVNRTFAKLNTECLRSYKGGSTAVVSVMTDTHIITAVVGDAGAILFNSSGELLAYTEDHSLTDPVEKTRIKACGGIITFDEGPLFPRLNHGLNIPRSFGDKDYIRFGLIAYFRFFVWERTSDCFLALFSDSFDEEFYVYPKFTQCLPYSSWSERRAIRAMNDKKDALSEIFDVLSKNGFDIQTGAEQIVLNRVNKFTHVNLIGEKVFSGDNTSLILVDVSIRDNFVPWQQICPLEYHYDLIASDIE